MIYNLLLQSDAKTLSNISTINKEASEIVKDKHFWNTKMLQDFNYTPEILTITSYYELFKAHKTAKHILFINKHERKHCTTDGIICINAIELSEILSLHHLYPSIFKSLKRQLR